MEDQSNKEELIRMLVDGNPITARNLMGRSIGCRVPSLYSLSSNCLDGTESWLGIERYKILRSSILIRIESIKIIGMETAYRHLDSLTRRDGTYFIPGFSGTQLPKRLGQWSDKGRFYLCTDDNGGILTKCNSEGVCWDHLLDNDIDCCFPTSLKELMTLSRELSKLTTGDG